MPKGKLVVIEGIDGTGKKTQFDLLKSRCETNGHAVSVFDFPRYGEPPQGHPASYFVRKYLQKEEFGFVRGYGQAERLGPRGASLLYAVDRFDAAFDQENGPNLRELLQAGHLVLSNRYTQSNIGHQASKIADPRERQEFIRWLLELEYEHLQIPKPDRVLLLNMPLEVSWDFKQKQLRTESRRADAHEGDKEGLRRSHWAYLEAAKMFSDEWRVINIVEQETGRLFSREEVHELVWAEVQKLFSI